MTVDSELLLKRGSNVVVGVSRYEPVDLATRTQLVVMRVATMLGAAPEYAGTLPSGTQVWVIGQGRPVFIRRLPENARLARWYRAVGEPVGDSREFWSVTIDWRGSDTIVTAPGVTFVIPKTAKVVRGQSVWPDGDLADTRTRVQDAQTDAALSSAATSLRDTYRHIGRALPSIGTVIGLSALGAGAVSALYVWRRH